MYRTLLPSPTEGGFAPRPYATRPPPAGRLSSVSIYTHTSGCCLCLHILPCAADTPTGCVDSV
jgi:hypothetical protein